MRSSASCIYQLRICRSSWSSAHLGLLQVYQSTLWDARHSVGSGLYGNMAWVCCALLLYVPCNMLSRQLIQQHQFSGSLASISLNSPRVHKVAHIQSSICVPYSLAVGLAAGAHQSAKVPMTTTKLTFAEVSGGLNDSLPSTLAGRLGSLTLSHRLSVLSGSSGGHQRAGPGKPVHGLRDGHGTHFSKQPELVLAHCCS